jgi:hypothetical protein
MISSTPAARGGQLRREVFDGDQVMSGPAGATHGEDAITASVKQAAPAAP